MQKILSLCLVIFLCSCAENYRVSTNLDKKNFENYFGPSHVHMYDDESQFQQYSYEYIGLVEGEDCQEKDYLAKPDEVRARTDARLKAYKLGANGIVFSNCVIVDKTSDAEMCVSTAICYGSAYKIDLPKEK